MKKQSLILDRLNKAGSLPLEELNVPEISGNDVEYLTVEDIWDGPLTGTCEWKGKEYFYYECGELGITAVSDRFPTYYVLIDLTEEQKTAKRETDERRHQIYINKELTKDEHREQLDNLLELPIALDQIVGWFSSINKDSSKTSFLQKYIDGVSAEFDEYRRIHPKK